MSYIFYFEVNSNNINKICNYIKYNTNWNGFSLKNTNPTNFPNYLDSNLTLHSDNIQLSSLTIPKNTFIKSWDDVVGLSNVSISGTSIPLYCSKTNCQTWYPPNEIFNTSNYNSVSMTNPMSEIYSNSNPYSEGSASNIFSDNAIDIHTYGQSYPVLTNPTYDWGNTEKTYLSNTSQVTFTDGTYLENTANPWNYTYTIHWGQVQDSTDFSDPRYIIYPETQYSSYPNAMDGNVIYTVSAYKPISYNLAPTLKNGIYSKPSSFSGGFYNYGFFVGNLQLVYSSNSSENTPCNNSIGRSTRKSSNSSGPTIYAVYGIRYNIKTSSFSNSNFTNQLLDFLNMQQYLYNNSSSTFQSSDNWTTTMTNIQQLLIDYCNYSGNMNSNLCSGGVSGTNVFPFTDILPSGSPCLGSSSCFKGWDKYCFTDNNFTKSTCNNYFTTEYVGDPDNDGNTLLNDSIVYNLEKKCQTDYFNTESPEKTLSQEWWDTCACFLPNEFYDSQLKNMNMENKSLGTQSCWYLPCQTAGIKRETNPICPNNDITNCIQNSYITYSSNNPNASLNDNIVTMNQVVTSCGVSDKTPTIKNSNSGIPSLTSQFKETTQPLSSSSNDEMTSSSPSSTILSKKNIGISLGGLILIILIIVVTVISIKK